MFLYRSILFVAFLAVAHISIQAQSFEGQVVMQKHSLEDNTIQQEVAFTVKGHMVQLEMNSESGPARIIKDLNTGMTTALFEKNGKKFAYTSLSNDVEEIELDPRHAMMVDLAKEQVKFEITEEVREIDGYECVKINARNHREEIEAWVTSDIDISLIDYFPYQQHDDVSGLDVQKMIWESGFVVEFWTKDRSTGKIEKITFSPTERAISEDVFAYQEDTYRTFDENVLNDLYAGAANDAEKMAELRELLELFQSR